MSNQQSVFPKGQCLTKENMSEMLIVLFYKHLLAFFVSIATNFLYEILFYDKGVGL
jgi:hypothetical protein